MNVNILTGVMLVIAFGLGFGLALLITSRYQQLGIKRPDHWFEWRTDKQKNKYIRRIRPGKSSGKEE